MGLGGPGSHPPTGREAGGAAAPSGSTNTGRRRLGGRPEARSPGRAPGFLKAGSFHVQKRPRGCFNVNETTATKPAAHGKSMAPTQRGREPRRVSVGLPPKAPRPPGKPPGADVAPGPLSRSCGPDPVAGCTCAGCGALGGRLAGGASYGLRGVGASWPRPGTDVRVRPGGCHLPLSPPSSPTQPPATRPHGAGPPSVREWPPCCSGS